MRGVERGGAVAGQWQSRQFDQAVERAQPQPRAHHRRCPRFGRERSGSGDRETPISTLAAHTGAVTCVAGATEWPRAAAGTRPLGSGMCAAECESTRSRDTPISCGPWRCRAMGARCCRAAATSRSRRGRCGDGLRTQRERERERAGLHCTTRRNGAPVNVARYAVDSLRDVVGATFLPFRPYRPVLRLGDGGDMEPVDRSSIVLVRDHSREAAVVGISSRQCDDSDGAWVCAAISCQISSSDRLELCG